MNEIINESEKVISESSMEEEKRLKIEEIKKYKRDALCCSAEAVIKTIAAGILIIFSISEFRGRDLSYLFDELFNGNSRGFIVGICQPILAALLGTHAASSMSRRNILLDKVDTLKEELDSEEKKGKRK